MQTINEPLVTREIPTPAFVDPAAEVAIDKLPPQTLALAHQHVQGFIGNSVRRDRDWDQIAFAPVARYLHDPGHQQGAVPAYVEFRVITSNSPSEARGYILVSLTEDDYPVPEFATRGETKTDAVVQTANSGTIHKFMRFAPGYIVAEDAKGMQLGALGTAPMKLTGSLTPGQPALTTAPAANYEELKSDFANNPLRLQPRTLRSKLTAGVWRISTGTGNPTLQLSVAETKDFLPGKSLVAAGVVAARPVELVRLLVLPQGGLRATGLSAGSIMVRVEEQGGSVDYYTVSVTAAAQAGSAITTRDLPLGVSFWVAGTDWDGDQRQYDQLKRKGLWCPYVGCGPTALAMLFGWWDANGVPSAFYTLDSGRGDAHQFRFNYESLRDSDAPKDTSDAARNEAVIVPLYDDLHRLSNTICFPTTDQGATPPDQMVSAFQEYVSRISDSQPAPRNEYGDKFVAVKDVKFHHVLTPGLGITDWEGGGKMVAHGIQAGYPGVVGIGSVAWDLHYPLAYGYLIVSLHSGSEVAEIGHYFKCNMGFGPGHAPEFHHAEDVWFGLTAHFSQMSTPTSPNDVIAATFTVPNRAGVLTRDKVRKFQRTSNNAANADWPPQWNELPDGEFLSGPAACASADGRSLHVFGRGMDNRIWRAHSPDGGVTWDLAWAPIGDGVFNSAPAAAVSADGQSLHVFGRGQDNRIWRAYSPNGGATWDLAWAPIGDGVFQSAPAAAVSANGQGLHVFGRGQDNRIWRAYSPNGGATWDLAWAPIGDGVFISAPAAAISANGQGLHVFGRGQDNRIWRAYTPNGGATWDLAWAPIGEGVFNSAPAAAVSANGQSLHVFGRGQDNRVWRAHTPDGGATWDVAWAPIGEGVFNFGPAVAMSPDGHVIHVFGVGKDSQVWRAFSLDGGGSWPVAWGQIGGATAF